MLRRMIEDSQTKPGPTKLDIWMATSQSPRVKARFDSWRLKQGRNQDADDKEVWRRLLQSHSVGFTVIKREQANHVFNFTSASQNNTTFVMETGHENVYRFAVRQPTRRWADAIVNAVNAIPGA